MTKEEIIKNNQKIDWFNGSPIAKVYTTTNTQYQQTSEISFESKPCLVEMLLPKNKSSNLENDPSLKQMMKFGIAQAKL